ncbi:hypothetical protein DSM112329_02942 [Paraconexibacter sp. AEG42_29]|uniref:Uncharacterized protein n=1 Tax=Paraconexibacter sp. AEG42_29 TaxID=2997339 RepID=A0AAU7AWK6_9ACTN
MSAGEPGTVRRPRPRRRWRRAPAVVAAIAAGSLVGVLLSGFAEPPRSPGAPPAQVRGTGR